MDTETKILQLTLSERDAEAVCGAIGLASILMHGAHIVKGVAVGEGSVDTVAALILPKDLLEKMVCGIAVAHGVPCPEHECRVPQAEAVAGQKDCSARLEAVYDKLTDFILPYRRAKIALAQSNLNRSEGGDN